MRPTSQLGGEGEAGSHPLTFGDHRKGAPSQAPFICKDYMI